MTQLKEGIFIERFDTTEEVYEGLKKNDLYAGSPNKIYMGKTSEISEGLVSNYVSYIDNPENNDKNIHFKNYNHSFLGVETAKESIKSACNKEYCIIYKK